MQKCLNCGSEFSGNFCNNCGQKKIKPEISVKTILKDFFQVVLFIESNFFSTFKESIINPGGLTTKYISGKRKAYISPINYFIIMLTFFLLFFNFFGNNIIRSINETVSLDEDITYKSDYTVTDIQNIVKNNSDKSNFLYPPIIAFLIWLFYRKKVGNFAELLVFSFYLVGGSIIYSFIIVSLAAINIKFLTLRSLVLFLWYPYAIHHFIGNSRKRDFVKCVLLMILGFIIFLILIAGFAIFYVNIRSLL